MACHLVGAKPLSEPLLPYCQLDPKEHISVKFESKYRTFHSRKCTWKCRLESGGHFVSALMCSWNVIVPNTAWSPSAKVFDGRDMIYGSHFHSKMDSYKMQNHFPALLKFESICLEDESVVIYKSPHHTGIFVCSILCMNYNQVEMEIFSSSFWRVSARKTYKKD